MSPLPRRMLGSAASWENPQVHPLPLPEVLTYVVLAVAIRLFGGFPHQILNSPTASSASTIAAVRVSITTDTTLLPVHSLRFNSLTPCSNYYMVSIFWQVYAQKRK